MRSIFQHI